MPDEQTPEQPVSTERVGAEVINLPRRDAPVGTSARLLEERAITVPARPSKADVLAKGGDAMVAHYAIIDGIDACRSAAQAVLWGAMLVKDYNPTNAEISSIIKAPWQREEGERTIVRQTGNRPDYEKVPARPEKGDPAHPYKQHARRWKDLFYFEARLNTTAKPVEKGELPVEEWPIEVKVGGKMYTSPVQAMMDGQSMTRTHIAFVNVLRPRKVDLTGLPTQQNALRVFQDAFNKADSVSVAVRQYNKAMQRQQKTMVSASDNAIVALGLIAGLLTVVVSKNKGLPWAPEYREALAQAIEEGRAPELPGYSVQTGAKEAATEDGEDAA